MFKSLINVGARRLVGAVPWLGADEARTAVSAAWDATQAGLPAWERAAILDRVATDD